MRAVNLFYAVRRADGVWARALAAAHDSAVAAVAALPGDAVALGETFRRDHFRHALADELRCRCDARGYGGKTVGGILHERLMARLVEDDERSLSQITPQLAEKLKCQAWCLERVLKFLPWRERGTLAVRPAAVIRPVHGD